MRVEVTAEVYGAKSALALTFDDEDPPRLFEVRARAEEAFQLEANIKRDERPIQSMRFLGFWLRSHQPGREWADLVSGDQLAHGCQLYAFRSRSEQPEVCFPELKRPGSALGSVRAVEEGTSPRRNERSVSMNSIQMGERRREEHKKTLSLDAHREACRGEPGVAPPSPSVSSPPVSSNSSASVSSTGDESPCTPPPPGRSTNYRATRASTAPVNSPKLSPSETREETASRAAATPSPTRDESPPRTIRPPSSNPHETARYPSSSPPASHRVPASYAPFAAGSPSSNQRETARYTADSPPLNHRDPAPHAASIPSSNQRETVRYAAGSPSLHRREADTHPAASPPSNHRETAPRAAGLNHRDPAPYTAGSPSSNQHETARYTANSPPLRHREAAPYPAASPSSNGRETASYTAGSPAPYTAGSPPLNHRETAVEDRRSPPRARKDFAPSLLAPAVPLRRSPSPDPAPRLMAPSPPDAAGPPRRGILRQSSCYGPGAARTSPAADGGRSQSPHGRRVGFDTSVRDPAGDVSPPLAPRARRYSAPAVSVASYPDPGSSESPVKTPPREGFYEYTMVTKRQDVTYLVMGSNPTPVVSNEPARRKPDYYC
ncbi:hypothetical protein DIPPA_27708 [Diplonema papillatum]|nr:hypothetical protein DIPPA_27708 [Diplonema papillatum]